MTRRIRGDLTTQGQSNKTNCESPTHMVKSGINESSGCSDKNQKVDCKEGKSGKCNMCSAPCKSCLHTDKAMMKSGDESDGENCTDNVETGPLSELCSTGGMNSTSDSFSESAIGKGLLKISNLSTIHESTLQSKSDAQIPIDLHDDCLSEVSGTDENAILKCDLDFEVKCKQSTGERLSSSTTGLYSRNSNMVNPSSGITDESKKVDNNYTETSNSRHDQTEKEIKERPSDIKDEVIEMSDEHIGISSQKDTANDVRCVDTPAAALDSNEKKEDMHSNIKHADEDDDSDMVEQDVKVCDICGDAGREDLLAICSRCSDGAEHTYCMRVMLSEVPEGYWLCDECQNMEKAASERPKKVELLPENESVNNSNIEGQRTRNNYRLPAKRQIDDINAEVSSKLKKQAIETLVASSKTSTSGPVTAAPSRASSSKSLDKETHHSCIETVPVNDIAESTSSASELRLQKFRGTFLKSNSFNSLNSKPKVKLLDQAVIQRQKSLKESCSSRCSGAVLRSLNKSASFKLANSFRNEPKVKMVSPRLPESQNLRTTKQRSSFKRQISIKKETTSFMSSASASKIDKKPAFTGESSSLVANKQETKHAQTESKTAALSRSSSFSARRNLDSPTSVGDVRRPTYATSALGVSSCSGVNGVDQRSNEAKEDSSGPIILARSLLSSNGGPPDGLPRPADSTDFAEKPKERSESHLARTSAKPSKLEIPNIRAAIEAASLKRPATYLKRPVTYLKNRTVNQSVESPISSSACDLAPHQDRRPGFTGRTNTLSDTEQAGRSVASENLTADHTKLDNKNNRRQSSVAALGGCSVVDADRSSGVHLNTYPSDMPLFMKHVTVPEHDYIWQGSFEVFQSGKSVGSWEGIQAHLSSTSSPKVVEAVKSFKSRIVLHEMSRLSSWPMQFQEHSVSEDNIALFFFAKDLDSYNKIYKVSLDNMMKKDLALKGNINDVELLIYPSNQLPENSQRWNMMFFLWGVFRAKKETCLQANPEPSSGQVFSDQNTVKPVVPFRDEGRATNEETPSSEQLQLFKAIDGEKSGVEKEGATARNGAPCSKEEIPVKSSGASFDAKERQQRDSIESIDDVLLPKVESREAIIMADVAAFRTDAAGDDPSSIRPSPKEDNRIKADLNLEPDDDDDDCTIYATAARQPQPEKTHNEVSLFPSFESVLATNRSSSRSGGDDVFFGSSKTYVPDDRTAPNLELALGGSSSSSVQVVVLQPAILNAKETTTDASLSLGLSSSVPFPPAVFRNSKGK